jgi:hypothetical protein
MRMLELMRRQRDPSAGPGSGDWRASDVEFMRATKGAPDLAMTEAGPRTMGRVSGNVILHKQLTHSAESSNSILRRRVLIRLCHCAHRPATVAVGVGVRPAPCSSFRLLPIATTRGRRIRTGSRGVNNTRWYLRALRRQAGCVTCREFLRTYRRSVERPLYARKRA